MATLLADLAGLVGGTLHGPPDLPITGAATLATARPGEISFLEQGHLAARLVASQATAVIVPHGVQVNIPAIEVDDVLAAFAAVVCHFRPPRQSRCVGVSPLAYVSPTARLGDGVDIHPGATVGDDVELGAGCVIHSGARVMAGCRLGEQVTVYPNAVLYEDTVVGPRCVIHAGAVVGAFGFGYKQVNGRNQRSAQLGYVILESDVEVGACTTIDRGTFGPTIIGEGTKLDNLVMIGHNCRIGRHNLICSQVGIAGSSSTGDYVVMAGQAGVRDHVHVGDRAVLGAQCGVPNDVPPETTVLGSPARPIRQQKLIFAAEAKLPEWGRELKELRAAVAELAARLNVPLPAGHDARRRAG
jgi:UDP-3-O-[3-hydroxymyristoyl] glucosamine N-acyltransferase